MAKRVTIIDVAREAGVSRQTVTRAMNGLDEISEATRTRVLEVSERLGYRPSRFARNLVVREKVHALGLIVASFRNPYFTDIAGDIITAAGARGWQVIMGSTESGDEDRALQLLSNQVDVLVGHFGIERAAEIEARLSIPVVSLEETSTTAGVHSVAVDLEHGIRAAVTELRARGASRFGMVDSGYTMRHGSYQPSPRRGYFEAAVGDALSGVVVGEETISGGGRAFAELLQTHPGTDAVLMFNDLMALGAVQIAHATGVDVPGTVRIVGVDGLSLGEAVDPALSTISLDRAALARHTLDIVDELAAHDFARITAIHRITEPKLIWRQSA